MEPAASPTLFGDELHEGLIQPPAYTRPAMAMVGHAQRLTQPLTRAQRRVIAIVLIAIVGACVYLVARSSSPVSRNGCITVTFPGSMGGQVLSHCGAAARSACASAYGARDPLALRTQTQCRLAGIKRRGASAP